MLEMEDPDSASLQAAMDVPVTASLGPVGPLLQQLHSFMASDRQWPNDDVIKVEIQFLQEDLQGLCISLQGLSEAGDVSFTAKWWMKEVRELCYDTEDYFDEAIHSAFVAGVRRSGRIRNIFLVPKKLQWRPQIAKFTGGGCSSPSFLFPKRRKMKPRPQTANRFSELMARVDDLMEKRKIFEYDLGPLESYYERAGVSALTPQRFLEWPVPASSISLHVDTCGRSLVGVNEAMNKLVDMLAFDGEHEKQLRVVPIFGFTGVGKTTFARNLYQKYGGKFQCRAFLRVSRNPNVRKLLTSLLSQIKAPRIHPFSDVQHIIDSIIEHLQGKRFLIIIDDLWTTSVWDVISQAFPDGDYCSRIITTTQFKDVALACCSYHLTYVFEMSPFNEDQSRKLFFHGVFGSEDYCPPDLKGVSSGIIMKCGGLPLVIANIASLLAKEPNLTMQRWKLIQDSLPSILATNPNPEAVKEFLNLVYNNLPPNLKTCLLYFNMYPEDYTIEKDDLVKQWIAECFLSAIEAKDREEIAGIYFDELINRGMIQPVDMNCKGKVLSCAVHHMVYDLIRHKSAEENLVISVDYLQRNLALPDKVRRLSLQFGGARSAKIPESIITSQIRSLIFCGPLRCVPSVADYRLLRVLVLRVWADQDSILDLSRAHELFRLKYLKIEFNSTIKLPAKIQRLQNLEALELGAKAAALPSDISHLEYLLHLHLPREASFPGTIGRMTSLCTLSNFDLSINSKENVMDLGKLTNLRDLRLICSSIQPDDNLKNNMEGLGQILEKLGNLRSVTLAHEVCSNVNTLDDPCISSKSISCYGFAITPPPQAPPPLERLELSRHCCILSNLPKWTNQLDRLCILNIAVGELLIHDVDILRGLPALTKISLYIWKALAERIVFGKVGFSVLRYLKFRCSKLWMRFEVDALPNLQKLKLGFNASMVDQHGATSISIEHLPELKEISAKIWGAGPASADANSLLTTAVWNHPRNPRIDVQLVEPKFHGDQGRCLGMDTDEKEQENLEEQDENLEVHHGTQFRESGKYENKRAESVRIHEKEIWIEEKSEIILEEDTEEYYGDHRVGLEEDDNKQVDMIEVEGHDLILEENPEEKNEIEEDLEEFSSSQDEGSGEDDNKRIDIRIYTPKESSPDRVTAALNDSSGGQRQVLKEHTSTEVRMDKPDGVGGGCFEFILEWWLSRVVNAWMVGRAGSTLLPDKRREQTEKGRGAELSYEVPERIAVAGRPRFHRGQTDKGRGAELSYEVPERIAVAGRPRFHRGQTDKGRGAELRYKFPERIIAGNGACAAASLYTMQGKKGVNQDAMIVCENFCSRVDTIFCGVFDGHGPYGHLVAKRVRDILPVKLGADLVAKGDRETSTSNIMCNENEVGSLERIDRGVTVISSEAEKNGEYTEIFPALRTSFLKAFHQMDRDLKLHRNIDCFFSGTTAVAVIKQGSNLILGNLGDSRAVLGTRDEINHLVATQLTVELTPNISSEAHRITQRMGRIFALPEEPEVARVWLPKYNSPGLAISRAFGVFCLKDHGVISMPDVSYHRITEKDEFIVLATDGVWNVLSNEEVVRIVSRATSRASAARFLVESAHRAWRARFPTSKIDDCTVVCLFLNTDEVNPPSSIYRTVPLAGKF